MKAHRLYVLIWCACVFLTPHSALAKTLELKQVVMLSRHGVRSPLTPPNMLRDMTENTWPSWPGAPGDLTSRGATLARFMGSYYRQHFSDRGLFSKGECPADSTIRLWANTTQRTQATGAALLDGMFPGCGLKVAHQKDEEKTDSLFSPLERGICPVDPEKVKAAMWGQIGYANIPTPGHRQMGESLLKAYAHPLQNLQKILECCKAGLCPNSPETASDCSLEQISMSFGWDTVKGKPIAQGPLAIAAAAVDNFLLQYAEGFPMKDVAWGKLSPAELRDLFRFQTLLSDLQWKNTYLAKRQSSAMLYAISQAITGAQEERKKNASSANKFTLFVGHDKNIAALTAMLNLDFVIDGYQPNQIPLGGGLAFEILKDAESEEEFIQVVYYAQTLDQLRNLTPLNSKAPPDRLHLNLPGCGEPGSLCPLKTFMALLQGATDLECVDTNHVRSILSNTP